MQQEAGDLYWLFRKLRHPLLIHGIRQAALVAAARRVEELEQDLLQAAQHEAAARGEWQAQLAELHGSRQQAEAAQVAAQADAANMRQQLGGWHWLLPP